MMQSNFVTARIPLCVLCIAMFFAGCGGKANDRAENKSASYTTTDAATTTQPVAENIPGTEDAVPTAAKKIGAFIISSDPTTKLFEQGAKLADNASIEIKFAEASQATAPNSASLESLIEKERAPVVLYWTTDDISPVAPFISGSDAVGIVVAEVTKKLIPMGANVFGFGYSTELTFTKLAKFAGNTLKSYRFAILTGNDARSELQSKAFIEESKSLGNTIVFEEKISPDTVDFTAVVARAAKENCDTIFAALPASSLVKFIQNARAKQFKGKIIVGDTLFAGELSTLGKDAEGVYMAQAWSDDAKLKSQYASKFGSAPDGVSLGFVALGFDAVSCLQSLGEPFDAYSIKSALLSSPCHGLTGDTGFDGERMAKRRKSILTVKSGQFVLAE
ncbi:MAG: ABC transporter substrate-binding protein [Bdellovibrionota bacterium]